MSTETAKPISYFGSFDSYSLDEKKRATVPAVWRALAEGQEFRLKIDPERGFIQVMTEAVCNQKIAQIRADGEKANLDREDIEDEERYYMSGIKTSAIDKQGRMVLPADFCEAIQLKPKEGFIMIGAGERFEIWNLQRWKEFRADQEARHKAKREAKKRALQALREKP